MSAWDHVEVTCANCGAPIMLHRQHDKRLRESHATFYCPAGHSNYFPGKTQQQKDLDELGVLVKRLRRSLARTNDRWGIEIKASKGLARAVQVCPLGCGHIGTRRLPWQPDENDLSRFVDRVGHDLTEHLVAAHNATVRPQRLLTERSSA
jgi:hypothetical protein